MEPSILRRRPPRPLRLLIAAVLAATLATTLAPAPVAAAAPAPVEVSVYIVQIQHLSTTEETVDVDVWVSGYWRDPKIDPISNLVAVNEVSSTLREVLPARPQRLRDGRFRQALHIRGTFDQSADLGDYPFDTQTLRVSFEERSFDAHRIVMVAGRPPIYADPGIHLAGFSIGKPALKLRTHVYPPNFRGATGHAAFAQVTAALPITRPVAGALVTTFVPIAIVLLSAALMFALRPEYVEARVGVGITTLLTLVALQLVETAQLPVLGYATVLEVILIASYVFVLVAIALVARTSWLIKQDDGIARAVRFDRRAIVLLLACYAAVVTIVLIAH
jgi:hypothetical protein